ncbi:MAG: hypothetical protein AAGJ50_13210 [Pseudomonadota bacterium]
MMIRNLLQSVLLVPAIIAMFAVPAAADEAWRDEAVKLAKEEPKIRDAMWSQSISFWITLDDDGTDRSGYASFVCLLLNQAGKPEGNFVIVTAWDHVSTATNNPKQLGKAQCN